MNREVLNDLTQSQLLTVKQACKTLGLCQATLYRLMENGQLAYVKIGRARRIPQGAIHALVAESLILRGEVVR